MNRRKVFTEKAFLGLFTYAITFAQSVLDAALINIAGALTIKELRNNPQFNKMPVVVIDDDPSKYKRRLDGVPVFGGSNGIERVAMERNRLHSG